MVLSPQRGSWIGVAMLVLAALCVAALPVALLFMIGATLDEGRDADPGTYATIVIALSIAWLPLLAGGLALVHRGRAARLRAAPTRGGGRPWSALVGWPVSITLGMGYLAVLGALWAAAVEIAATVPAGADNSGALALGLAGALAWAVGGGIALARADRRAALLGAIAATSLIGGAAIVA